MKQQIKAMFGAMGYQIKGTRLTPRQLLREELARSLEFDDLICRRMVEVASDLHFIQIGAFDGMVQDPLRKYINKFGWRGVMVEPQPAPAQNLHKLYDGNDKITVMQAALDRAPAKKPFFVVNHPDAPHWAGALASFDRNVILKHTDLIPGLEKMIEEVTVDCVTFDDVLARLPGGRLDLLQIDTEGADAFILSLFPFERVKPAIVHWEIRHLSFPEREDCLGRLAQFGYRFASSGDQDMLAVAF